MPKTGEHPSEKTREKLQEARKGYQPFLGKNHSDQTKERIRRILRENNGTDYLDLKVSQYAFEGLYDQQIADRLGVSIHTVRNSRLNQGLKKDTTGRLITKQ